MVGNNAHLDLPVRTLGLPTPTTTSPLTRTGSGVTLPSWPHYRYRHHNRLHRRETRYRVTNARPRRSSANLAPVVDLVAELLVADLIAGSVI